MWLFHRVVGAVDDAVAVPAGPTLDGCVVDDDAVAGTLVGEPEVDGPTDPVLGAAVVGAAAVVGDPVVGDPDGGRVVGDTVVVETVVAVTVVVEALVGETFVGAAVDGAAVIAEAIVGDAVAGLSDTSSPLSLPPPSQF